MKRRFVGQTLVAVAFGVFLGTSIFTFGYAKGYSYMLNDPEVCINCHVMRDNYKSWRVSSHRGATCNDCHVPHGLVRKYIAKGINGYRHSWAFTFGTPDVIRIKPDNQHILNENCIGCHEKLVDHLSIIEDKDRKCVDCHKAVGHGV